MKMKSKTFLIFRHGQTDWNLEKRCQGHTDIPLNSHGRNEALELALRLKNYPIEVIYSSDLSRALETARLVAAESDLMIIETPLLRETHMGEAEGLTINEITRKFGEKFWHNFRFMNEEAMNLGFPGGETRAQSLKRLKGFVESLLEIDEEVIALSTHGGSLRSLLHSFLPDGSESLAIPNCVVYELKFEAGKWSVKGPLTD